MHAFDHPGAVLVRVRTAGDACALDAGRDHHRLQTHPAQALHTLPSSALQKTGAALELECLKQARFYPRQIEHTRTEKVLRDMTDRRQFGQD